MKKITLVVLFVPIFVLSFSQGQNPKLVVGIVVDQMRADYLYKFWHHYGEDGFKRILNDGYNFKNTHFDYLPTNTGPGHASIYTGATPAVHGIVDNDSFNRFNGQEYYCAEDPFYFPVGALSNGNMSPKRMQVTTLADEIYLYQRGNSKSIGISGKDRGAIFPAGHTGTAYWLNGSNFMTSTYYLDKLPEWVTKFNRLDLVKGYLDGSWELKSDGDNYLYSDENNKFERKFDGEKDASMPHNIKKITSLKRNYDFIKETPFGNTLLVDFAIEAIKKEQLGQKDQIDMLSLSFSSTDYVGHRFGTESLELEDTYARLDADIARLLTELDDKVGKENYLLFLTSDHGAAYNPDFLNSHSLPGGVMSVENLKTHLDSLVDLAWGQDEWISYMSSNQVFLNHAAIYESEIRLKDAQEHIKKLLLQMNNVERVYSAHDLSTGQMSDDLGERVQKGFNQKWGGDLFYLMRPHYFAGRIKGTTHGSAYNYDSHVPLLLMGWGIPKGESTQKVNITDIVPTLSFLLNINLPSGAFGNPIDLD